MDAPTSRLTTSKQIKLIEAVTFMLNTIGKLRDQGIALEDFPPELADIRSSLHVIHSSMTQSLSVPGRDYLMRSAIKIPAKNPEQGRMLERKLFELGFGYFIAGDVIQLPTTNDQLLGLRVNKRGHISSFISGEDESYFESDLSRLVQPGDVLKAKTHADL